jgi:hypothetical protein
MSDDETTGLSGLDSGAVGSAVAQTAEAAATSAPPAAPTAADVLLESAWFVDRSRIQTGRIGCRRARYREYHSGPTGYGIRHKAQALPLVTGAEIHGILAQFMLAVLETGALPDDEAARATINASVLSYHSRCSARGYLELANSPDIDDAARAEIQRVVQEQTALVEALGWALYLAWLPALLEEWEPVLVEEELLLPISKPAAVTIDAVSTASPILLMSRPDLVLRRRSDGTLAQWEAKTVGGYLDLPAWRRQWEDSAQLMLTKLAIQNRLNQPVSLAYIFAMDKGRRSKEKASQLYKQWSFFLYVYHRAANPPMVEEDWKLRWEWIGEDGKSHRLGKGYERTAIFTYPFPGKPEEMSSVEFWMRQLPVEEIMAQHEVLGPYDFPDHSTDSIVRGVAAEEEEWRERLFSLWQVGEACGWNEADPRFVDALDRFFPQSWNCHAYGKDCQFLPICKREPLWAAPHEDDRFEIRRPHHSPELEQMKARGIEVPLEDLEAAEGEEA